MYVACFYSSTTTGQQIELILNCSLLTCHYIVLQIAPVLNGGRVVSLSVKVTCQGGWGFFFLTVIGPDMTGQVRMREPGLCKIPRCPFFHVLPNIAHTTPLPPSSPPHPQPSSTPLKNETGKMSIFHLTKQGQIYHSLVRLVVSLLNCCSLSKFFVLFLYN